MEHLDAWKLGQALRESARGGDHAVDERCHAIATETAQRCPHRHPSRPSGHLRDHLVRVGRRRFEKVCRVVAERSGQRGGIAHDGDARVVGGVERLVGVGGPRVRVGEPGDEMRQLRAGCRPQSEGPVDVQPATGGMRGSSNLGEGVEAARVNVPGLGADDDGALHLRERGTEGLDPHPPLLIGRHLQGVAEAEVAQREVDRAVPLSADENGDRRSGQSPRGDIPPHPRQHLVPGSGERREVGHRGAGDEAHRALHGQSEELDEPPSGGVLDGDHAWGRVPHPGVLVPCGHEPVRGQRGREGTPHHPAEEPG